MINTIFYFVPTYEEYQNKLVAGEIAARTIVFVTDQKSVYRNGVRYGSMSKDDIQTVIQLIFDESPYILPIATKAALGGVMVGDFLNVSASTGKLDVDKASLLLDATVISRIKEIIDHSYIQQSYTLPTASTTTKGGIRIAPNGDLKMTGDVLSINLTPSTVSTLKGDKGDTGIGILSVRKTGTNGLVDTYTITYTDGTTSTFTVTNGANGADGANGAKGDKGDKGDRGKQGPTYDDTELQAFINQRLTSMQNTLNGLDTLVTNKVNAAVNDADWIRENITEGEIEWKAEWDDEAKRAVSTVGYWTEDDVTGAINTKYSTIEQSLQSISARVTSIEQNPSSGGGSTGTALTAEQRAAIEKVDGIETAVNQLSSSYAEFETNEANELTVTRWLASVLGLYAQPNATWAQLSSATNNVATGQSALANLETRVDSLEDGLVASASLETMIQDKVNQATSAAGFVTTSSLSETLGNYATSTQYATLSNAVSSATAALDLKVGYADSSKTYLESSAKLYADKIQIDANHQLNLSAQNITVNGDDIVIDANHQLDLSAQQITVNADDVVIDANHQLDLSAQNITIDADDINLVGQTNFFTAVGQNITVSNASVADSVVVGEYGEPGCTIKTDNNRAVLLFGPMTSVYADHSNPYVLELNSAVRIAGYDGNNVSGNILLSKRANSSLQELSQLYPGHFWLYDYTRSTYGSSADMRCIIDAGRINIESQESGTGTSHGVTISAGMSTADYLPSVKVFGPNINSELEYVQMEVDSSVGPRLKVSHGGNTYQVLSTGGAQLSDMRKKNVIEDINISIDQIADAPLFTYTTKDGDDTVHVGTSAQYWQEVLPNSVITESDGTLMLMYDKVSTVSAISAAKEIVKLKEENEQLKNRLAVIEEKLALLEK